MSTIIKSSVEYTDYDTSSGNLSDTLTATVGKEYEIRNSGTGGNTLTITYGSDSIIFNDGESGRFTYDGTSWSTQFSNTVVGTLKAEDGIELTSGRNAFYEIGPISLSGSNWFTLAELPDNDYNSVNCDIAVSIMGAGSRRETIRGTIALNNETSARDHMDTTVEIVSQSSAAGAKYIEGLRLLTSSANGGAKLEVYINDSAGFSLTAGLYANIGSILSSGSGDPVGFQLVTPTISDGNTPDGIAATEILIAGEELASINVATFGDPRFFAYAASSTSLRVSLLFEETPYPGATIVTFPVGFSFKASDGTTIYTVTASDTMNIADKTRKTVSGIITTTGLTSGLSGFGVGAGFSAVLS